MREPGSHTINLEIANLAPNTILFGQIEIRSTYLKRIIFISGGTFGIPEKLEEPNKDKPVFIGNSKKNSPETNDFQTPKAGDDDTKNSLTLLFGIIFMIILAAAVSGYYFLSKNSDAPFEAHKESDILEPQGEIIFNQDNYQVGDTINFTIKASDDNILEKVIFKVEKSKVEKSWIVNNSSAVYNDSFSTQGWLSGIYAYFLSVEDKFGNTLKYSDKFVLNKKELHYGYINIFTKPYAEMYVDEKFLGKTPKSGLKLPAGQVKIRFVNKADNIDVTEQINVKPDETVRISFKWK